MQEKRGYALEGMIDASNATYRQRGKALVEKAATPWKVQYRINKRTNKRIIKDAWPEKKGGVDYTGVASGIPLAFDAKSTREKSLPLKNIKNHQIEFLSDYEKQNGVAFLLVEFAELRKVYYLRFQDLKSFWAASMQKGGRKSIPLAFFQEHCPEVHSEHGVILDYLSHVHKEAAAIG